MHSACLTACLPALQAKAQVKPRKPAAVYERTKRPTNEVGLWFSARLPARPPGCVASLPGQKLYCVPHVPLPLSLCPHPLLLPSAAAAAADVAPVLPLRLRGRLQGRLPLRGRRQLLRKVLRLRPRKVCQPLPGLHLQVWSHGEPLVWGDGGWGVGSAGAAWVVRFACPPALLWQLHAASPGPCPHPHTSPPCLPAPAAGQALLHQAVPLPGGGAGVRSRPVQGTLPALLLLRIAILEPHENGNCFVLCPLRPHYTPFNSP